MKIRRKAADTHFSNCIRERANWTCERCGRYFPENHRQGLECSHFHGRAKYGVRFDPLNCEALCTGCHMYLTANPIIHTDEKTMRAGIRAFNLLLVRANSVNLGRTVKRLEKDISNHYRNEFKLMKQKRSEGFMGRLEFNEFKCR